MKMLGVGAVMLAVVSACSAILGFEDHTLQRDQSSDGGTVGRGGASEVAGELSFGGSPLGRGGSDSVLEPRPGGAPSGEAGASEGGQSGAGSGGAAGSGGQAETGGGAAGVGDVGGAGGEAGGSVMTCAPRDHSTQEAPIYAPSCLAGGDAHCKSLWVPGGRFRMLDADSPAISACTTISGFYLDEFEVTVARFRRFVAAYDPWRTAGNPVQGAGKHPKIDLTGWQNLWSAALPADAAALRQRVSCEPFHSWTNTVAINEDLPMNCVDWYVANAFCTWDGARLPTEAEWAFAAVGGSEERIYAWGDERPREDLAVYSGHQPARIGSVPEGAARWGQNDMAGSVYEWTFDYYGWFATACNDCAAAVWNEPTIEPERTYRGGSFAAGIDILENWMRGHHPPADIRWHRGFRCARDAGL